MNVVPWLCYAGTEIANEARTLTYISRGLAGTGWQVEGARSLLTSENCRDVEVITGDVYVDTYVDLYGGSSHIETVCDPVDRYDPRNLACFCADVIEEGQQFVDPATDEAPWYVAGKTASEEFLGVLPVSIVRRPSLSRVSEAAGVGALFGPLYLGPQFVEVTARLIAASDAGMDWGERWLLDALSTPGCDELADLQLVLACGGGVRTLVNAGIVDTPVFEDERDMPTCKLRTVSFQMASEMPWHFAEAENLIDAYASGSSTLTGLATTEELAGDGCVVFTIEARHDVPSVTLSITPTETDCSALVYLPCFSVTARVPAGYRLTIDPRTRLVEVRHMASGHVIGGLDYLDYSGMFSWPDIAPCTTACVKATLVGAPSGTTVTADFYLREL